MTSDNVPELVARLREDAHRPGVAPATAIATATALESLHAEVERCHEEANDAHFKLIALAAELGWATDGRLSSGVHHVQELVQRLRAALADRDAQIAEALAWAVEHGAPAAYPAEPFTFNKGVTAAATDLHAILSRSPRGAASYSRSSLPVHQCRAPEAHYGHRWRDVGLDHDEWCMGRAFDDPSWVATGIAP